MRSQTNIAWVRGTLLVAAFLTICFATAGFAHAQAPPGGGDGGGPAVAAPRASGGTETVGEINSTNTGVILNVAVPADAVYVGGSLQPEVSQDDGSTFFSVGTAHIIADSELDTAFDLAAISISAIESALGNALSDGMTLTFREVTTDSESTVHDAVALGQLLVNMPADTTAPVIDAHADVTAEATSASGASVSYTAPTATDNIDASVTVICLPASGGTFAIGTTTVTCNASDAAENAATATTFTVRIADTPVASPEAGTYTSAQSVSLFAEGSPSIRYTTDGSTPTCAASTYSSAISVGSSLTIKALSCYGEAGATASSSVASFDFTINIPAPAPAPAPSGGGGGGGGGGSAGGDGHSLFPVAPVVGVVMLPVAPAPVASEMTTAVAQTSLPAASAAPVPGTQRPAPRSTAPVAVSSPATTNEVREPTQPVETETGISGSQTAAAGAPQREKIQWGPQVTTVDYGIKQLAPFLPWFILFILLLVILLALFRILRTSDGTDTEYSEPRV